MGGVLQKLIELMQGPCRGRGPGNAGFCCARASPGGKNCRDRRQEWLETKGPARGDGQGQGSQAEASDLGDAVATIDRVPATICSHRLLHKRTMGRPAMQNWRHSPTYRQKKRLHPKMEPDDRAEAKSKVMAPRKGGGYAPDRVGLSRGRRIRLKPGVA